MNTNRSFHHQHSSRRSLLDDSACNFELETTFDDNMGSFGNMFDIRTINGEISIFALEIYVDVPKKIFFEIYTKINSFRDDEGKNSLKPWELVKKGFTTGAGRYRGTMIRDFTIGNITMAPNELRAFYVTLNSPDLRYRDLRPENPDTVIGDLYKGNEDLELYVGISLAEYPLQQDTPTFGKRAWSGRIHYLADRTCAPSASPSLEHSVEPTVATTLTPTEIDSTREPSVTKTLEPAMGYPTKVPPSKSPTSFESETPSTLEATSLPTVSISMNPSHPEPEEWMCSENKILATKLDGLTGAYGNMFTVTAKDENLKVTTLSFHTDNIESYTTVMVFTKPGNFVGFENEPRSWRKASESKLRGAGIGYPTKIPEKDFQPVYIARNKTVAFYITLTSADIRYTRENSTVGDAVTFNDYLSINTGVGVADYPFASEFFLYSPRNFNGIVHFSTEAECLPTMNITYSFTVSHSSDLPENDLAQLVATNVELSGRSLAETTVDMFEYTNKYNVSVDSSSAEKAKGSCKSRSKGYTCSPIDATLSVRYSEELREGRLRFSWLKLYGEISLRVNQQFMATYIGDVPVEDRKTMFLNSAAVATPMSEKTKDTFELVLMKYLQNSMGKQVTILDVQATDQKVKIGDGVETRRYLQRGNDDATSSRPVSTIEVSVNVNGQYRPPPEIDYSGVVEDAMDSNPQDFEQSLKREDKYFEIIESVKAQKEENIDSSREDTPPPESPSGVNVLVIVFVCLIIAFIALVCGTIYFRRRQRKNKKFSRSSFVIDSKLLKEKKSIFGAFGKGGKSIIDAFSEADAVWDEKSPVSGTNRIHQPSSHDKYPISKYRDDTYEDEADINEVKVFQDMGSYGFSPQASFGEFRDSSHFESRGRNSLSSSFHSPML